MAKHDHDHGNDHHHSIGGHHHVPANFGKAFAIGIALNLAYVVGEEPAAMAVPTGEGRQAACHAVPSQS